MYHAFYSNKQKIISENTKIMSKREEKDLYYKLYNSDKIIEVTELCKVKGR